jgi:hypothetical protein
MSTITRSRDLVKASWRVLSSDKELVLFPILSSIAAFVVMIVFAVPGFVLYSMGGNEVLGYVLLFLFYVVLYTVIILMNAALVGAALIRLKGGDPTVGDGLRIAFSHFGVIVGYALIASTVGMLLQALSDRGTLGNIVKSILGTAWNLITYLVVPVLVVENVGPIEAVQKSAVYLKRTWGEQVTGGAGMGVVFLLLFLGATLIAGAGVVLGLALELNALVVVAVIAGVILYVALALLSSTLGGIYSAAVYRYAAEGQTSGAFAPELIQNAFRTR